MKLEMGLHPWAPALRALDPVDTKNPAQDITAVYLRQAESELQVRVDLLDIQSRDDLFLDIKIGDVAKPQSPLFHIQISSKEYPTRIALDPQLDTVTINIPLSGIPSHPLVDVSTAEDEITGLLLESPVPSQTAPLLLTFYDTFAGRFPAEALRRWDGAHSGPRGERHGLKHLLDAAEKHEIPITLLDLKEPKKLSALDAMGWLPRIQQMEKKGLLLLPDQAEQVVFFGLSPSKFMWGRIPQRGILVSRFSFIPSIDTNYLYRPVFSKNTLIPVATTDSNQPTPDGPPLEVRRALLETALNAGEGDLLVLGGSLRNSTWGSPDMVGATLAYFASRPYIHILTADDLTNFPTKLGKPELRSTPQDKTLEALEAHYKKLTQPMLDFVANWMGSPLSNCETDLDKDGQPECVLANEGYLAILDPQGARLTYLFAVGRTGREAFPKMDNPPYIQLVGPSWQVAVGLSNPSMWDLSAGEAADPGAYPGAFADVDSSFQPYTLTVRRNTIVFTSLDGARGKTFSLDENGLQVEYQTQEPINTQIPLLVDPETRFTPGWAETYVQEKTSKGIAWGLANGPMVRIQFEGQIKMRVFNESLSLLKGPEDPDFSYPVGHYVPFSMAIGEVEMREGYFLRLERRP